MFSHAQASTLVLLGSSLTMATNGLCEHSQEHSAAIAATCSISWLGADPGCMAYIGPWLTAGMLTEEYCNTSELLRNVARIQGEKLQVQAMGPALRPQQSHCALLGQS